MKKLFVGVLCFFVVILSGTAFGAYMSISSMSDQFLYTTNVAGRTYFTIMNATGVTWKGFHIYASPDGIPGGYLGYYEGPGNFTSTYPEDGSYDGSQLDVINLNIPYGGAWVFALFVAPAPDSTGHTTDISIYGNPTAASPVPIPGALVLFGSGLLGLVGIGRRRFKK